MGPTENQYVAIDPMALILPGPVYWRWVELHYPHVPSVADVKKSLSSLSPDEKRLVSMRAKVLGQYAAVVEEALRA